MTLVNQPNLLSKLSPVQQQEILARHDLLSSNPTIFTREMTQVLQGALSDSRYFNWKASGLRSTDCQTNKSGFIQREINDTTCGIICIGKEQFKGFLVSVNKSTKSEFSNEKAASGKSNVNMEISDQYTISVEIDSDFKGPNNPNCNGIVDAMISKRDNLKLLNSSGLLRLAGSFANMIRSVIDDPNQWNKNQKNHKSTLLGIIRDLDNPALQSQAQLNHPQAQSVQPQAQSVSTSRPVQPPQAQSVQPPQAQSVQPQAQSISTSQPQPQPVNLTVEQMQQMMQLLQQMMITQSAQTQTKN